MPIQCPIQVDAIAFAEHPGFNSEKVGMLVHIKPCEESLRGKTFIGVYLGDMQISVGCSYHPESKKLEVYGTHNPAIYVPALRRVVWGCGSWWRALSRRPLRVRCRNKVGVCLRRMTGHSEGSNALAGL